MAAESLSELRSRIAQQCEELKRVHAQYLGALDAQGRRMANDLETKKRKAQKDAKRKYMVDMIRATDAITAACADTASKAKELLEPKLENPSLKVAEYIQAGRFMIDGRNANINGDISQPLIVPLLGHGNIVVIGNNTSADSFIRLINARALQSTEPNQLQLVAYDPSLQNPLAPFSVLADDDADMIRTYQTFNAFDEIINECRDTVQRVGNLMMGSTGSLVDYRRKIGMPVEQYSLITLYEFPGEIQKMDYNRLIKLIAEAPRYGISFIIRVTDPKNLPEWCSLDEIKKLGSSFDLSKRVATWNESDTFPIELDKLSPIDANKLAKQVSENARHLKMPIVDFNTIQPKHDWGQSTAKGITFALGREGISTTEITIGDDRAQKHNILVTGAVGQGKSNLLKVMIYSMCSRYSPDELELYLLDFKDGVTLAPMAPSENSPSFLPQARILGLQADQSFGFAILDSLRKEMERRSRKFKQVNVDNVAKYRGQCPNEKMPRIVVFIDEFQMLLNNGNDGLGSEAAKKLEEVVRLGRAYGIHVVLASQTISGIQALATTAQGLFAQFPIRIGLKNSPAEAQATFGMNNLAASRLHYRGQAIVNLDYGAPDSNRTVMVAMARDEQLNALQEQWWKRVQDQIGEPMVFDGTRPANLCRDLVSMKQKNQLSGGLPKAYLGRPVAVDTRPVSFSVDASPGRCIAIVGSGVSPNALEDDMDNNMGIGIIEAIGLSLAAQKNPGTAKFIVMDCLTEHDRSSNHVSEWIQALKDIGHDVETFSRRECIPWLEKADDFMNGHSETDPPIYVFVLALERMGDLNQAAVNDLDFGFPADPPKKKLFKLFRSGPLEGIHMFVWWSNFGAFDSLMALEGVSAFDGTVLLYGTKKLAQNLYGPLTSWDGEENRASFKDSDNMTSEMKIIPYQPLNPVDLSRLVEEVRHD